MCASLAVATTSESLVDFSKLPSSALDNYIAYNDRAKTYPPPPAKRRRSSRSPASDEGGSGGEEGEDGEDRASKRIDSSQTITTSTRLRPRSPTVSMAHYFPGGTNRQRNSNGNDEMGLNNGMAGAGTGVGPDGFGKEEDVPCPSHFFDAQEADDYLANVASRHFANQPPPKEGEVVVQFLYRCRAGGMFSRERERFDVSLLSMHPSTDKCLKVAT
jgi:hypothetical protein